MFSGVYEVLPTEPLHDVKEHICNVVSEIKDQLQEEKQLCVKTIELVAQTKEPLCGSDREMAIVLSRKKYQAFSIQGQRSAFKKVF